MEYPITFFLDMAWNPAKFTPENIYDHTLAFCREQFGAQYAEKVAYLLNQYTFFNHRRTPELLDQNTYSLENYNEWERVKDEYVELSRQALQLYYLLPDETRDAFDQLVLFPIQACANLYEMYYAVAMNRALAEQGDAACNEWADRVKELYARDSVLNYHYNHVLADGKWNHFMDQTHIGYTYWQQPNAQVMPQVTYLPEGDPKPNFFAETDGYVSIEANHYARAVNGQGVEFVQVPFIGKTEGGVTTLPAGVDLADEPQNLYLEYDVELTSTGEAELILLFSPTLNFNANRGLRYAVSVDGGAEQVVNINPSTRGMERWQGNAVNQTSTRHTISSAGKHTLRVRFLDSGLVLQKLMLDLGGLKRSYLGAPESLRIMNY
jgi:hypothetical protein